MNKEQFFTKYVQPNTVVHCATEELANELLAKAHEYGLEWSSGLSYLDYNNWEYYKDQTCYNLYLDHYRDIEWYQENDYTIIEFNGFEEGDNKDNYKLTKIINKLLEEELAKPLKPNGKRGYTSSTRIRLLKQIINYPIEEIEVEEVKE